MRLAGEDERWVRVRSRATPGRPKKWACRGKRQTDGCDGIS